MISGRRCDAFDGSKLHSKLNEKWWRVNANRPPSTRDSHAKRDSYWAKINRRYPPELSTTINTQQSTLEIAWKFPTIFDEFPFTCQSSSWIKLSSKRWPLFELTCVWWFTKTPVDTKRKENNDSTNKLNEYNFIKSNSSMLIITTTTTNENDGKTISSKRIIQFDATPPPRCLLIVQFTVITCANKPNKTKLYLIVSVIISKREIDAVRMTFLYRPVLLVEASIHLVIAWWWSTRPTTRSIFINNSNGPTSNAYPRPKAHPWRIPFRYSAKLYRIIVVTKVGQ